MAILKCHHCGYTKGVSEQYVGKSIKCPECGQAAKVYDTALLLTAYSKKVLEIQSELKEVRQVMTEQQSLAPQMAVSEELTNSLAKIFRENRIAMTEFGDASKLHNSTVMRVEDSNAKLLRFSIVGFVIMFTMIAFFALQMANNTAKLTQQLSMVNSNMQTSNTELNAIREAFANFDSLNLEPIVDTAAQDNMTELQQEISRINERLKTLSQRYDSLLYRPYR